MGVSSSSGVPSFVFPASASSAPLGSHPPPGFPQAAPGFTADPPPTSFFSPFASDPFSDPKDRFPEDDRQYDPSALPLPSDSSRSEYCHMIEYVLVLFPQASGVPPTAPPPRALFESFFATASPSLPSLAFNWFDRVHTALVYADARMAAFLAAGRSDRSFLPPRHTSYVVRGERASGRAVPVSDSFLAHFDCQLCPTLFVDLSVKDAMSLEASFRTQSESLSYSVGFVQVTWVCSLARFLTSGFFCIHPARHLPVEEFN